MTEPMESEGECPTLSEIETEPSSSTILSTPDAGGRGTQATATPTRPESPLNVTGISTAPPPNSTCKGGSPNAGEGASEARSIGIIDNGIQKLTVSGESQKVSPNATAATKPPTPVRASTPPPPCPPSPPSPAGGVHHPLAAAGLATPKASDVGRNLHRTHSSPSLLDASPKNPSDRKMAPRGSAGKNQPFSGSPNPAFRSSSRCPPGHELTPVIRNTASEDSPPGGFLAGLDDSFVVVSPDEDVDDNYLGETEGTKDGGARRRRKKFLSLSVPSKADYPVQQLQQRTTARLVPAPQSNIYDHAGAGFAPSRSSSSSGRSSATPSPLYAQHPQVQSSAGGAPRPSRPIRHHSVGNLDAHSLFATAKACETSTNMCSSFASLDETDEELDHSPPFEVAKPPKQSQPRNFAAPHNCAPTPDSELLVTQPIQFPSRKFFSFNGRHQYRRSVAAAEAGAIAAKAEAAAEEANRPPRGDFPPDNLALEQNRPCTRRQYQPTRREHSLTEIGLSGVAREELSQIFNTSPRPQGGSTNAVRPEAAPAMANGSGSSPLRNPIPLEERQWSIPSIRLAIPLQDVSTTSYTCSEAEEDEDDLLYRGSYDDDASLSSRGSSLFLPEDVAASAPSQPAGATRDVAVFSPASMLRVARPPTGQTPQPPLFGGGPVAIIEDGLDRVVHPARDDASDSAAAVALSVAAAGSATGNDRRRTSSPGIEEEDEAESPTHYEGKGGTRHHAARPKKKRTKKAVEKERRAVEWLRTVEIDRENDFLAEAASSKFLTGGVKLPPVASSRTGPRSQPFVPIALNGHTPSTEVAAAPGV